MNEGKLSRIARRIAAGRRPFLMLVIGLPGSSKSTFARTVSNASHYEADMFFVDENGNYNFDRNRLKEAHEWCRRMTENDLRNGRNVVVSNTGLTHWERMAYYEIAEEYGADIKVKVMTGDYGSIHNVPQESLDAMRRRYQPVDQFEIKRYGIEMMD